MCIEDQVNSSGEEVVEVLHGYVDRALLIYGHRYGLAVRSRVVAEGGQKVAHPALRWIVPIEKAKAVRIVRIAGVLQILECCTPLPTVDHLPTDQEKERHRVKGYLALC
jgi:hypothetical protein